MEIGAGQVGANLGAVVDMRTEPLQARPKPVPVTWTAILVRERLREAYEIEKRMPSRRHSSSAWLFPTIDTFADIVGRTDVAPIRLSGVTAEEMTRWAEAIAWLRILRGYPDEMKYLAAWAACSGSVRLMLARRNIPRATFYRRMIDGSERIARALNNRGVTVR